MKLFAKKQITQKYKTSKKDSKKYSKILKEEYNFELPGDELYVYKHKGRFFLLTEGESFSFFNYKNVFYPTINTLNKNNENMKVKTINLDKGAKKPILTGANVMARGVYVNYDVCDDFLKDDVVIIKIENEIIAVGKALISKTEIKSDKNGEAIEIYHSSGDDLYLNKYF